MKASLLFCIFISLSSCMSAYKKSVGGDSERIYTKLYLSEYQMAWEAAVEALKAAPMEVVNRENGTLQTKWLDNTAERNLIDSAGSVNPYQRAQVRFRLTVAKTIYDGEEAVRTSVQKEQQVQRDVLEGWINQETDGIQENSLLYRVGRLIQMKLQLQAIENERIQKQLQPGS